MEAPASSLVRSCIMQTKILHKIQSLHNLNPRPHDIHFDACTEASLSEIAGLAGSAARSPASAFNSWRFLNNVLPFWEISVWHVSEVEGFLTVRCPCSLSSFQAWQIQAVLPRGCKELQGRFSKCRLRI